MADTSSKTMSESALVPVALCLLVGLALFAVVLFVFPRGVDYYQTFEPSVASWQAGVPVFSLPPQYGFYNAPWLLPLLAGLQLLTPKGAEAALCLLTIAILISCWRRFIGEGVRLAGPLTLAMCIFNLHMFDLMLRGQIDAFVLLGVLLMYLGVRRDEPLVVGAGWVFSVIRPTSVSLIGLYTIWIMVQRRQLLKALVVPVGVGIVSLVVFDPGWIGRWIATMRAVGTPQPETWIVTLWKAAQQLGISQVWPVLISGAVLAITGGVLWRYRPDTRVTFGFLATASLIVAPYALSYHYSVLMALFVPILVCWRFPLAVPLYVCTLMPVLRVSLGANSAWLDIVLPVIAWLLLIVMITREKAVMVRVAALPLRAEV